jgi:hypothetical protein
MARDLRYLMLADQPQDVVVVLTQYLIDSSSCTDRLLSRLLGLSNRTCVIKSVLEGGSTYVKQEAAFL